MTSKKIETLEKSNTLFTAAALTGLMELLDPEKCADWLFGRIWPGESGTRCPRCLAPLSEAMQRTFRAFRKCRCNSCGKQFRALTGSPFYHVRMSPVELVLIAALLGGGISPKTIATVIGCGEDTIYIWRRRFAGLTLLNTRGFADDE